MTAAADTAIEVRGEAELRLLEPVSSGHVHRLEERDPAERPRRYRVVSAPEVVEAVAALFDAAWRTATERSVYETSLAGLRDLAPSLLDALASGSKDEAAARAPGMSLRTYRRRVAELMAAVGATSRFQAGLRARELGLV